MEKTSSGLLSILRHIPYRFMMNERNLTHRNRTASRAITNSVSTSGIAKPTVVPIQKVTADGQIQNQATWSPDIKPFQLRSGSSGFSENLSPVAPGADKAWHVIQQKHNWEKAVTQLKKAMPIQLAGFSKPLSAYGEALKIFNAFMKNEPYRLLDISKNIRNLNPQIEEDDLPKVNRILTLCIQAIQAKKTAREGTGTLSEGSSSRPSGDGKESKESSSVQSITQSELDGLIPGRLSGFIAEVKSRLTIIKGIGTLSPKRIIQTLFDVSQKTLLPELNVLGAYPELIIQEDDSEVAGLFSRDKWTIALSYNDEEDGIDEAVFQLASTIAHETRHVEQAWMEIYLSSSGPTRKGYRAQPKHVRQKSVTSNSSIAKKLATIRPPAPKTAQLEDTVKRGKTFTYGRGIDEAHDKLNDYYFASELRLGEAPEIDDIIKFFEYEVKYYTHPREMDAYAVERQFGALWHNG